MRINEFKINYLNNRKQSNLFEMVIKEALENVKINEDELKIITVFIEEDEAEVKASLILINNIKNNINFEDLELLFKDEISGEYASIVCDLRFLGVISPLTITPFEIRVDKSKFENIKCDINELKVDFNSKLKGEKSVIIPGFEVQDQVRFEDKVEAKIYLKNKEFIKENTVNVKTFKLYINENGVNIPLLAMNGCNSDITINNCFVALFNVNGTTTGDKKLANPIEIKANSAKLFLISFTNDELKQGIESYKEAIAKIMQQ